MLKLRLEPAETVNPEKGLLTGIYRHCGPIYTFSNGERLFYNKDDSLYTISEADIDNWQKTGNFSFNKVTVEGDGIFFNKLEEANGILSGRDNEDHRVFYPSTYDDSTHTLTTTARCDWHFNSRGYIVRNLVTYTSLDFVVVAPSGRRFVTNIPVAVNKGSSGFYKGSWTCQGLNAEGYVACVLYAEKVERSIKSADSEDDCTMVFETTHYNLSLVKTDGTLESVWKYTVNALSELTIELIADYSLIHITENNFYSGYQRVWICNPADKIVKEMGMPEMKEGVMNSCGELVHDEDEKGEFVRTKLTYISQEGSPLAIMFDYKKYDDETQKKTSEFLATLNGERISENYSSLWSYDFEIFLAHSADDKWGYIDKTGKPLAFFDDAGEFAGEYAPVVQNGKAFLINRQMEQVSEIIDADGISSLGDRLYKVKKDGKQFFMTYAQE